MDTSTNRVERKRSRRLTVAGSVPGRAELTDLLLRSGLGDVAAFSKLYDLTGKRIYGLVLRRFGCTADADRQTQLAYVNIWRQAGGYQPKAGHALAWMIGLVHHQLVEQHAVSTPTPAASCLTRVQQEAITLVYLGGYSLAEAAELLELPRGAVSSALRDGLGRLKPALPAAS